ncbi:MAG: hypothetical protein WCF90_00460 [Methanomicrobiales archaeon]
MESDRGVLGCSKRDNLGFLGNAGILMIQRIVRIPKHWDVIVLAAAMY